MKADSVDGAGAGAEGRAPGSAAGALFRAALRRPALGLEAVRTALASAAPGWARRFPFLPRPAPSYLDWRLTTAYGRPDAAPSPEEAAEFLSWRRRMRKA